MLQRGVVMACIKIKEVPEKVKYILDTWGDTDSMAIMAHFRCEQEGLKEFFKHAEILSADGAAEGLDLSHKDTLIIYSMSFSTSKHIQRRARQANKNRKDNIQVEFILVKGGISEAVYRSVAEKRINFTKASYEYWKENLNASK